MECKLIHVFFEMMSMIAKEQRTPRDYGNSCLLYHSELNFISTIHSNPKANAKELAELLGVTQGAVTQVAGRLAAKNLIEPYTVTGNKKERYYKITPMGESIRLRHHAYHAKANAEICKYFCSLNEEESAAIFSFFEKMKECMPVSLFACQSEAGCKSNIAEGVINHYE